MLDNFLSSISDKTFYLLLLVGVVFLFILSLLPLSPWWIVIKILFFLALLSFLVLQYRGNHADQPTESEEADLADIGNSKQDWLQIENDQDVEEFFQKFLENALGLVKKVLVSDTVILLFANYSKKEFTIRFRVSDHPETAFPRPAFDIYKGLPSLVLRNRTPLIENHLPAGQEIIPYYKMSENPSNSFAAVPVYFRDHIIGVLCVDSVVEEAYSNEDLEILRHFGHLVSIQLYGSNQLYEYESENWLAKVLADVSQNINQVQTVDSLWQYLLKKVPDIIPCDRISISQKLNDKQGRLIAVSGGTRNPKARQVFALDEGIVGWVMRKNQTLLVDDFSTKENYVPRFSSSENPSREYYSLLALPVSNQNNVLAVICLESFRLKNFKEQHKRILQTICHQSANMFMTTHAMDHLRLTNFKDLETDLENMNAFKFIYPKEVKRAEKQNYKLCLLFLKPYFQMKEKDAQIHRRTLKEFLSLVLPSLSASDYIFRLFPEIFVVILSHLDAVQLKNFTDKIWKKLAEKKIWADGQAFDVYVNMGFIPGEFMSEEIEKVIAMGEESIKQARLQGPNQMAVFQPNIPGEAPQA